MAEVLPDTRCRVRRGVVQYRGTNYVPIYCGSCKARCGYVRAEHVTSVFALCSDCAPKYGHAAHLMEEPDAVFWRQAAEAQAAEERRRGHLLTSEELARTIDDPTTLLSRVAKEWQAHARKDS